MKSLMLKSPVFRREGYSAQLTYHLTAKANVNLTHWAFNTLFMELETYLNSTNLPRVTNSSSASGMTWRP